MKLFKEEKMKYFEPHNRHLWIEVMEEEKEEKKSTVLMPESYKQQESFHTILENYVLGVVK